MPCYHPIPAARSSGGGITLTGRPSERLGLDAQDWIQLPCGSCVGCRYSRARSWAIRCGLELSSHRFACWTTLTYDDSHLPPTLQKRDLQLFLKRLRARVPDKLRFFACGEYGEHTWRPHYHAILYGTKSREAVEASWKNGFCRVDELTPAAISYVAGYCQKKMGVVDEAEERIDRSTGEVYQYQPPFIEMSRRPGIGADARKYMRSWRRTAVWQGREVPVPRYLHEAYKAGVSEFENISLVAEKRVEARKRPFDDERNAAGEAILRSRLSLQTARRSL